jgi:hypothetical protein
MLLRAIKIIINLLKYSILPEILSPSMIKIVEESTPVPTKNLIPSTLKIITNRHNSIVIKERIVKMLRWEVISFIRIEKIGITVWANL